MKITKLFVALLAFTILSVTLAPPLLAQTSTPILSLSRLSIAAGVDREVLLSYLSSEQATSGVLAAAYNVLSPQPGASGIRISLTARFAQSFDSYQQGTGQVGFRITLFRGAP